MFLKIYDKNVSISHKFQNVDRLNLPLQRLVNVLQFDKYPK